MQTNPAESYECIARRSRRCDAFARQAPRRLAEAAERRQVAESSETLAARGQGDEWVAPRLHLSRRTLRRWRHSQRQPCQAALRGRPCKESSREERRAVLDHLEKEGVHLGLPSLRAAFPHMPRCELKELQQAYRGVYRAAHRRSTERLKWHAAGTVWAMDHVHPPAPIDGVDRAVLAVRDLASGFQVAWLPVPDEGAEATVEAVGSLIGQHGPPLVVKCDNGPAFKSDLFKDLLNEDGIAHLCSPPRRPQYNGSCEAANGSLRVRTNHFARHEVGWTKDSLAAARRQANERNYPEGPAGPTPADRWNARPPIQDSQRAQLQIAIQQHRTQIIATWQGQFDEDNKSHQQQVFRQATRRALLDLGLLTITRRSITLPLKRKKGDNIP